MKKTRLNQAKGAFTIIELIAAMVITSIILGSVLIAIKGATDQSRLTSAVASIRSLQTACVNYYNANGGSYANLSLANLAKSNMLPANFTKGDNANPWNGSIIIGPDTNLDYFDLTLTNIPANVEPSLSKAVNNLIQTKVNYTKDSQTWIGVF